MTQQSGQDAMVSQDALKRAVAEHQPERKRFRKDQPIPAWILSSDRIDKVPEAIRDALGSRDRSGYTRDYLARNAGSVIALQMEEDGPDFYVIGKSTFDSDYETVPIDAVMARNRTVIERLGMLPQVKALIETRDPSITAVEKTAPVEMIAMSDIGLSRDREIAIAVAWGQQIKPAGRDGFLVRSSEKDEYYLVNEGKDGLPLNYVPAD